MRSGAEIAERLVVGPKYGHVRVVTSARTTLLRLCCLSYPDLLTDSHCCFYKESTQPGSPLDGPLFEPEGVRKMVPPLTQVHSADYPMQINYRHKASKDTMKMRDYQGVSSGTWQSHFIATLFAFSAEAFTATVSIVVNNKCELEDKSLGLARTTGPGFEYSTLLPLVSRLSRLRIPI